MLHYRVFDTRDHLVYAGPWQGLKHLLVPGEEYRLEKLVRRVSKIDRWTTYIKLARFAYQYRREHNG